MTMNAAYCYKLRDASIISITIANNDDKLNLRKATTKTLPQKIIV